MDLLKIYKKRRKKKSKTKKEKEKYFNNLNWVLLINEYELLFCIIEVSLILHRFNDTDKYVEQLDRNNYKNKLENKK